MREENITETYYYVTCKVCGKEFEVRGPTISDTCWDCRKRLMEEAAKKELEFLIGATIINVEPFEEHDYELSSVIVKATNGRCIELTAGGWEERHIDFDYVECE